MPQILFGILYATVVALIRLISEGIKLTSELKRAQLPPPDHLYVGNPRKTRGRTVATEKPENPPKWKLPRTYASDSSTITSMTVATPAASDS
jgi:hypothetical protein